MIIRDDIHQSLARTSKGYSTEIHRRTNESVYRMGLELKAAGDIQLHRLQQEAQ
jgi:hypothetical protein